MSDWKKKFEAADQATADAHNRKLHSKYGCHVCGKPATGFRPLFNDMGGPMGEEPTDLYQCERCMKWACEDCRYGKKCRACLEGRGGLSYATKASIVGYLIIGLIIAALIFL